MNILVLGGFGFLGGRITQHFLNAGYSVFQGTTRNLKSNSSNIHRAVVVKIDWNNKNKLDEICKGMDLIIHASGMNSKDCELDPSDAFNINAVATAKILQSAIKMKVKRFLYISTINIYSDKLTGKISESFPPHNLHPYASSHYAGENIVMWAQKNDLIDGIVIRVTNGFGVPINKEVNCWMLFVNDLCRQAVENKKLQLLSNGSIRKNFIPISEICNIINFLLCSFSFKKKIGKNSPLNIGGNHSFTLLEMAEIIQSRCELVLGYSPEIYRAKKKFEKKSNLIIDLTKLKKLGYKSDYSLNEEIDNLLLFCANNFSKS